MGEWLRREKGTAMLMAMLALVFMSIIGLAVLRILNLGIVHTTSAEARIQAEMLAQIGIDEVNAILQYAVDQGNILEDESAEKYRDKIAATIQHIKQGLAKISDDPTVGETFTVQYEEEVGKGRYSVEITSRMIRNPNDEHPVYDVPDYPYVQEIKITSKGETTHIRPVVSVTKEAIIYVSTIHPVIRYPLSASGELVLNGTPHIVGNIIVDNSDGSGDVKIMSEAEFIKDSVKNEVRTGYPSMEGFIRIAGQYVVDNFPKDEFSRSFFQHQQPFIDEYLTWDEKIEVASIVSRVINEETMDELIVETAKKIDLPKHLEHHGVFEPAKLGNGQQSEGISYKNVWVEVEGELEIEGNLVIQEGTLLMAGNADLTFKLPGEEAAAAKRSSIYVHYDDPHLIAAYLSGKIVVPDGEFIAIDGNVVMNNLDFQGTMFVRGSLKIIGDLNLTGSVYVDGDIEMKEMKNINRHAAMDASVVLVSSGKMILSENQENKIRAFLYTAADDLDLYGVISKLDITGGVHGRKVTINAIRGQASRSSDPTLEHHPSGYYFDRDQESFRDETSGEIRSRLQIRYDPSLYRNPPIGIPITDDIYMYIQQITYP